MRGEHRVLDTGHLGTPIPLDIAFARLIPEQPHTVQDCLSCACNLNGFNFQGAIRKDTQVIEWVERILEVPVWCNDSQLHTRDTRFQVLAIAVHRGDTPHSGHYQTCLIEHSQEYLTDDNIVAKPLRQCDRQLVSQNSYLLFCAKVA